MKTNTLTRRQFLIGAATIFSSAALHPLNRILKIALGELPDETPTQYLPLVSSGPPRPPLGKVIHIRSTNATHWQGEIDYWNYIDQTAVNSMVELGLKELTGCNSLPEAWQVLIPRYKKGQKIAIKVNFNNASVCDYSTGAINGIIQPINALVIGLEQIGVSRSDVCVYDAVRALPDYFVGEALSGISFFDGSRLGTCRSPAGFSHQPDAYVPFNPPPGVIMPDKVVTDVVRNATYLINMPIMKGGHGTAGVTLGFKNHFGTINSPIDTIDGPIGLHTYINCVKKPSGYRTDYNPLVDIYCSQHIGPKTVLTVGDALFAAIDFNSRPQTWSTFGDQVPNSLFFSVDPVAVDCVMHDFVAAQPGTDIPSGANNYLILASNAGLGIFESINPWNNSYNLIDYRQFSI